MDFLAYRAYDVGGLYLLNGPSLTYNHHSLTLSENRLNWISQRRGTLRSIRYPLNSQSASGLGLYH